MSGISSVLSALSFILSIAAIFFAARTATAAQELRDKLQRSPVSRIASLEESHQNMAEELQHLANRVKMMKVRRATDHVRDDEPRSREPDPYKDPDAWRASINSKLARAKLSQ